MLGVVETRQVLTHMLLGERLDLKTLAEQPLVILEHTSALKVMTLLRQHPNPVVVVIDEYGGVEGMATLSDLLSAIVGDFATTGDPSTPLLTAGDNGSWILDASMPLEQLEALLSVELIDDDQEFYTLGGLVLEQLQHIPEMGETFELAGFSFRVLAVEGRRISQVEVSRLPQEEDDSG
ncbi:MAG: CBS domain-containing protein [Moraxellaceae bacterium]|nr:MAG: CBS domain-containing protein [Moraxellaceae bacterium]